MKLLGSQTELVSIQYRKDSEAITLRPNQAVTYTANRDVQLPPQDADAVLVSASSIQTLSNKTLDNSVVETIKASNFTLQDGTDTTKQAQFILSGLTTGTTRSFTLPDVSDNILTRTSTDTIQNKTISGSNNTITNVSLTSGVTSTLPIGNGGTGQTTASAAFGALSPLTTKGDLLTYSTVNARLPVGTNGQVLSADSTQTTGLKWVAALSSSLTSAHIFVGNASNVATDTAVTGDITISNTGVTTLASTISGAKTWNDAQTWLVSSTLGSDSSATTVSLSMRSSTGNRTEINMFQNGVQELGIGVSAGADQGITGTVTGDSFIKTNSQALLFSGNNGTTRHGRMDSAGQWIIGTAGASSYGGVQVAGRTNAGAIPAGNIGETLTTGQIGSAVNVTTSPTTIGSLAVTAGVWMVTMSFWYNGNAQSAAFYQAFFNTTTNSSSGTTDGVTSFAGYVNATSGTGGTIVIQQPVNISSTTTYYAVAKTPSTSAGTGGIIGNIVAVRIG